MASSSSNLVNNLTKGVHKFKYEDCDCFLEYDSVSGDLISINILNYSKKTDENLKNRFKNIFKFSDDINKFILLLRKGFMTL